MDCPDLNENNETHLKIYEQIGIPQSLIIDKIAYACKIKLKNNNNFIYWCKIRSCKA